MKHIAIYGTHFNRDHISKIALILNKLENAGFGITFYEHLHDIINKSGLTIDYPTYSQVDQLTDADLFLSIGGDGTFLNASNFLNKTQIPIIGINLGRLGFLAGLSLDEIDTFTEQLTRNEYTVEKRSLIELDILNNPFGNKNFGLNEIAIHKKDTLSFLTIHAYINGDLLSTFWADGLLVATPTGSTAYSLSLGGPIITPNSKNFVITPIAPHTLTVRPIVVPDDSILEFKIESREGEFNVSIDSNCKTFKDKTILKLVKSNHELMYMKLKEQNFYEKLRKKLMWGSDVRN